MITRIIIIIIWALEYYSPLLYACVCVYCSYMCKVINVRLLYALTLIYEPLSRTPFCKTMYKEITYSLYSTLSTSSSFHVALACGAV